MMTDHANLAEELRACMEDHGYNLERLARESGVPKSTIHHWRSGKVRSPYDWEKLLRAARTMRLSRARTNCLLRSAGLPSIERLTAGVNDTTQRDLLAYWD